MSARAWTDYLPRYRLPRALTACFGCLALLMISGGLLIFLGMPALFNFINSLDPEPILDVAIGSSVTVGDVTITLVGLEDDSRVRFRTSLDDQERSVIYSQGAEYADLVALPRDYALRVLSIAPAADVVRFQLFHPSAE